MGRRLGQHFLNDPAILDRIVDAIDPDPEDIVLEVGAGRGTLTRRLAPRVARVIAIERDRGLAERLQGVGSGEWAPPVRENVAVMHADALDVDWHRAVHLPTPDSPPFKVIGNIPYAITTPLIEQALTPPVPRVIVFLVQQEVAERLAAAPGSKAYGALSVGVQVAARVEKLFGVRSGSFDPPPDVHSAVVRLTPLDPPLVPWEEHAGFRRFVTAVFGQRRKQLARVLRSLTGRDRADVETMLQKLGIASTERAEVLSPQEFVELYQRQLR